MENLFQEEGSQYDSHLPMFPEAPVRNTGGRNGLDGGSFMGRQMLGVKRCLNVEKEKMLNALHLKKKADFSGCNSAGAKTVHASDDVHTGQTKMDMFVAKVKNIAGKLPWNMKKKRNLDSCEKIDVDQNVVACHNERKTSKVFDGSSLSIQEVIDEP
ncbi:uncharacterized protein LOC107426642 [Ziziphus jujuba]|uniref:Uncharacterized protein LOC107426642 n=1 Tax=Ziziphus jujuba TaxID=326968 RepID=A0A6P6GH43_ZIZJJ|nr:uncharacterized protein LOC107426642 [Ziziphus jujuba]